MTGTTVSARMLREAVATRVRVAADLSLAPQPLGIAAQSNTAIHRAFFVAFGADEGAGSRSRHSTTVAIRQAFTVEIGHAVRAQAKDGDGASVWDAALDDREAVRKALLNHNDDALKLADGSLEYRGATTQVLGGGAYLVTTLSWVVTYPQELA